MVDEMEEEKDIKRKFDDDEEDDGIKAPKMSYKKIVLILLPVLILIGGGVSFLTISKFSAKAPDVNYHIVEKSDDKKDTVIFYDLPQLNIPLQSLKDESPEILRLGLSIELNTPEDIKMIDGLSSEITDIIISHTIELTPEEINGVNNLYWLKNELLYRINLVVNPIQVKNLNFKTFEIHEE